MDVQSHISFSHNQSLVGSVKDAIIEGIEDGMYVTRLSSQALDVDGVTYVESRKKLSLGDIIKVKITRADFYDLYAEPT
jgi:ribosomal protein S12 methylthiotransferase